MSEPTRGYDSVQCPTELHHALRQKPVMANSVVETLSRICNAAEDKGLIPEPSNPCGTAAQGYASA